MSGKDIISIFICIVILTWLSMGVNFNILILIFDIKRKIIIKEEIGLFNSIMTNESLCLTGTRINEERN